MFSFTIENSTLATPPWKYGRDYWVSFELYPDWKGRQLLTFKGAAYHRDDFFSQTMVAVKTLRCKTANHDDWLPYRRSCDEGRKLALQFNKYLESVQSNARVNFVKPTVAAMDNISDVMVLTRLIMRFNKGFCKDEVVLIEDLLEGDFKTFLNSKGETTPNGSHIMDAYSHFTYQASEGNLVVCKLRGVEDEDEPEHFNLTKPVVHSLDGSYGEDDRSVTGICDFFKNHVCSCLCKDFSKPSENELAINKNAVVPSAPPSDDHTGSKVAEADDSFHSKPDICELPLYTSEDPHGPPPYDAQ